MSRIKAVVLKPDPYLTKYPPTFLYGTMRQLNRYFAEIEDVTPEVEFTKADAGMLIRRIDTDGYAHWWICTVKDKSESIYDAIGSIDHEISHLVIRLFEERGITFNQANDEAFTYYHEWLLQQCLTALYPRLHT